MANFANAMEIFKLLDKSNCRECGKPTCLAFAGAVFTGSRKLEDCPTLSPETIHCCTEERQVDNVAEQNRDAYLAQLKNEVAAIDLVKAAERSGGRFVDGTLTLKVLGKNFGVDENGKLFADIHINPWVAVPFLSHVLYGKGRPVSGNWVSFRDAIERDVAKHVSPTASRSGEIKTLYSDPETSPLVRRRSIRCYGATY